LDYTPPDVSFAEELKEELFRAIRDDLRASRSRFMTRINNSISGRLASLLPALEHARIERIMSDDVDVGMEHLTHISTLVRDYDVFGFPVNVPFTDLHGVLTAVKQTGIHALEEPSAQFAVAVHVAAYPGGVYSVWVYLAALVPRRERRR
jgi:coiled-coil and C2 domain-containing protein 2A